MYGKLKQLSIEELEVEIEDLDICIIELEQKFGYNELKIDDIRRQNDAIDKKLIGLRALSELISDLILEKQREAAQ